MFNKFTIIAAGASLVALSACAPREEVVVVPQETPIYAKDGTIIGMRPAVGMTTDAMPSNAEPNPDNLGVDTSAAMNDDMMMSDGMDMDMDDDDMDG